jgi:hypothetical protein
MDAETDLLWVSAQFHELDDALFLKLTAIAIAKNCTAIGVKIETPVFDLIRIGLSKWHLDRAHCSFRPFHSFAIGFGRHL